MIPSLLQIPSAVSDSKLHSVLPNNGKGDFQFDRSTGATRINKDGLIEEVGYFSTEKLTGFTNGTTYAFTTFTTSGNNITSAIVSSAFAGAVSNAISVVSGQTYKVTFDYTKNSGNDLRVVFSSSTNGAGTQISNNHLVSSSGSYSFDFTITSTTTGYLQMGTGNSGHSLNASINNVSVKEVQGDRARLSYDITNGVVEKQPHLLLEPSSTNLFPFSEDYTQSNWNKSNVTITQNAGISPENINNASKIIASSNASFNYIFDVLSGSSSKYTISAFVKADGRNIVWLYVSSVGTNGIIYFDLSDESMQIVAGSAGTPTGTITKMPNGWYRITSTSHTFTLSSGSGIGISDAKGSLATTTDGTNGVLIYGLQIEAQSYATSYIPTAGTTITRAAETCNNSKPSVNSTEGVLYVETSVIALTSNLESISISDGTYNNAILFRYYDTSDNQIQYVVRVGSSIVAAINFTLSDALAFNKIALKYKENDFALWVNGTEVGTDTSGSIPSNLNVLQFNRGDGSGIFYGKAKGVAVYNEALTDAQLIQLTS